MELDIIIIGAGVAGLTAAIYAARAGRSVLLIDRLGYGGQIVNALTVENYPGVSSISGFELANNIYKQALSLGAKLVNEEVFEVRREDTNYFIVKTKNNEYGCKAVIIATGVVNRRLGLPNEEEFIGKGISYCATCDGMFYRGKKTMVVGGGSTAIDDALFLSNICEKVYLVHRRDEFKGEKFLVNKLKNKSNVEMILSSEVIDIRGEDKLSSVVVRNKVLSTESTIDIDGLFIAIGQIPDNDRFSNILMLDNNGYIISDESCKINTEGIFVAGDTRTKALRQLATAASDGAIAATNASEYIMESINEQ